MQIKIKKLHPGARVPERASAGAAAADLYADTDEITIEPGERALVPTGIAVELPSAEFVALVFARSGLAVKSGIALSNGVGVIDSDYRGEICVGLLNNSADAYTIRRGERIAQLAVMPVVPFDITPVDELSQTDRGQGGFGSTGKN